MSLDMEAVEFLKRKQCAKCGGSRFLITRAKGDAWPKTPCSKCGHRSVIKGFWHQRSGRWCGITETTEVGYKLPVTQTVIAWQIIPEKIIIEPYAEPADNIGEGV